MIKEELMMTRDVYGETLVKLGHQNPNIVVLDADLSSSTRTAMFAKEFPERFFNFGVAEQNMIGAAVGLASCGKIPYVSTFAIFATGRAWDQIRNGICYNNLSIKIVATHAGITVGADGSSHQALEDIAIMKVIPNMTIIVPCDGPETREAIKASASFVGPVYIRLGRAKVPTIQKKDEFKIGRARLLREGKELTIIACGVMVKEALEAAKMLECEGHSVRVVDMHTIKPIDIEMIKKCAQETKKFIVCEEHMVTGGLGSALSEFLSENLPIPLIRIGVRDIFGQSGSPGELMKEYNLTKDDIVQAAKKLLGK